jgi:hypothetical protein
MKNSIFVLLVLTSIISCKKKGSDVDPIKTNLEYLTGALGSKKWKVTDGVLKQGETSLPVISNQPACITDNIITLNSNGTYELTEGPSVTQAQILT